MKELLTYVAQNLVEHSEAVSVTESHTDGETVLEAEVPMAEMMSYAIDLRSMTQGRGSFTFRFVRYEDAPPAVQEKAIEAAKAMQEEAD